jgi:DNA repair ATPase RecN
MSDRIEQLIDTMQRLERELDEFEKKTAAMARTEARLVIIKSLCDRFHEQMQELLTAKTVSGRE